MNFVDPTRLVSVTPDAEKLIAYCARVSNPANQDNEDSSKLLGYCIRNKHWSIFEMAHLVIEVKTSRAISAQILRHRSFCFQEFSQRYAETTDFVSYDARRQDVKNRQNSIDDLDIKTKLWFQRQQDANWKDAKQIYHEAIKRGIAKECARMVLPMGVATTIYMSANVRSWIHYLEQRCDPATQKEHRDVANGCKKIFVEQFPQISKALEWRNP